MLNQHTRALFFYAYIQPDIDYALTCWDLASKNCLKRLQSLYRRSLKIILLQSTSLQNTDYKKLNILPFDLRCRFNKAVFMYKIMNDHTPSYLCENFLLRNVRGKSNIMTPHPRTDLFKSSLVYSGSVLWNEMPDFLKQKNTLISFKKACHKYLFEML